MKAYKVEGVGEVKAMEKLNVSELDFCAHDVEEESFKGG